MLQKSNPTTEQLFAYTESKFIKSFTLVNFQRKYRKFFKFQIFSEELFFINSKISKHSLKILVQDKTRFIVTTSKNSNTYEFSAVNDKEFINKLLQYDLV